MVVKLHLVVHFCDIIEQGKVLILNLDKVSHDLVQTGLLSDDLPDLLECIFKLLSVLLLFFLGGFLALLFLIFVKLWEGSITLSRGLFFFIRRPLSRQGRPIGI